MKSLLSRGARYGHDGAFVPASAIVLSVLLIVLTTATICAQTATSKPNDTIPAAPDYSGMYTFLQEGEFLQLTIEDQGRVSGFVSRYSDAEHQGFADHFFKQARLDGKNLTFTTEMIQNVAYQFKGTIDRGEGKKPGDEAYYVLNGTLTQNTIDKSKTTSKSQVVVFKSFPDDAGGSK